jgi:predicted ArsR family transcriptional regulator
MSEHAQLDADPQLGPERFDRVPGQWPEPHDHAAQLHRAILHDLRSSGPSSPDEVGRRVGTSRTSALQQLRALESAGLASHATVKHGVGRPRHVYDLTPIAQGLFPANYDGLATDMLAAIEAVGGQHLVGEVFRARRVAVEKRVRDRLADRLPDGATLAQRVQELAVIQDEAGYLCSATVEDDGTSVRLAEHNCAIFRVATSHPGACAAELKMFTDVLGADVVRESHIMAGDRCCSYRISEPAAD